MQAVLDGQVLAFKGLKVVTVVRVLGEHDSAIKGLGLSGDTCYDGLRLGRSQRTVDKIVLHIYDN